MPASFNKVKPDLLQKIFLLVVAAFLLRFALAAITEAMGFGHDALFFTQDDIFADSLKSGLAQRAVSAPLLHDPVVRSWPLLFQSYLFNNPYVGGELTIYHSPPLSSLLLMGVAGLLRLFSPQQTVAVLVAIYLAAVAVVVWAAPEIAWRSRAWLLLLLLLTYPAVWMIDRGNFHSGLTTCFVVLYLSSIVSGRLRTLGIVAIALAINLRPNVATIVIVEFLAASPVAAIGRITVVAFVSAFVATLAFVATSSIDPAYTLSAFLKGLAVYNKLYISGDYGLTWNDSLFGAVKSIWRLSGYRGFSSAAVLIVTSLCGLIVSALSAWLMVTRRTSPSEAVFLGVTVSALFTPVYAEYHILVFVAPVLILAAGTNAGALKIGDMIARLTVLLVLCWVSARFPNLLTLLLLVAVACVAPWLTAPATGSAEDDTATAPCMLRASLFALCPLGGELSNGIAVAVALFATSLVVIARCLRRPAQPIQWFLRESGSRIGLIPVGARQAAAGAGSDRIGSIILEPS